MKMCHTPEKNECSSPCIYPRFQFVVSCMWLSVSTDMHAYSLKMKINKMGAIPKMSRYPYGKEIEKELVVNVEVLCVF